MTCPMNFATILGLCAATLTTVAYVPQVIKIWKFKDTHSISLSMYVVLCVGFILWLLYGILIDDIPIIAANIVTLSLALTVLFFKLKYG